MAPEEVYIFDHQRSSGEKKGVTKLSVYIFAFGWYK